MTDRTDRSGEYEKGFIEAVLFVDGIGSPTSEQVRQAERTLNAFKAYRSTRRWSATRLETQSLSSTMRSTRPRMKT